MQALFTAHRHWPVFSWASGFAKPLQSAEERQALRDHGSGGVGEHARALVARRRASNPLCEREKIIRIRDELGGANACIASQKRRNPYCQISPTRNGITHRAPEYGGEGTPAESVRALLLDQSRHSRRTSWRRNQNPLRNRARTISEIFFAPPRPDQGVPRKGRAGPGRLQDRRHPARNSHRKASDKRFPSSSPEEA